MRLFVTAMMWAQGAPPVPGALRGSTAITTTVPNATLTVTQSGVGQLVGSTAIHTTVAGDVSIAPFVINPPDVNP